MRMLLLDSDLWHRLGTADHELLSGLETWHGEFFRWLERQLTEHPRTAASPVRAKTTPT